MTNRLRKTPRQDRSENTVKAILESACIILNELGVEGFGRFQTAKVAQKAGVSIGTLYQYFPNKNALLSQVLDFRNQEDLNIAQRVISTRKTAPASETIHRCVSAIITESYLKYTGLYKVIARYRAEMVRPETNVEMQEKIVATVQHLLENEGRSISNIRYTAFLVARAFIDLVRSTLVYRPEYILDPKFQETLAEFITATLPRKALKNS
jgi:AcrR family transcriptional regulator